MFYFVVIIDTIGSIDDLIEKYEGMICKLNDYLLLHFNNMNKNGNLKFKDVFQYQNGGTFKSSEYVNYSNYKLITIKNIDASGFNLKDITYLSSGNNKFKLDIGDILLTMTGAYLGRSGIVDEDNCYLNQRVLKLSSLSSAFTYCFLKAHQQDIFSLGKGSAQPNLSLADLLDFNVPYSLNEISFFKTNDKYIDEILNIKTKIKKLSNLKIKYLNKYFR